jgi:hypothetical protein
MTLTATDPARPGIIVVPLLMTIAAAPTGPAAQHPQIIP